MNREGQTYQMGKAPIAGPQDRLCRCALSIGAIVLLGACAALVCRPHADTVFHRGHGEIAGAAFSDDSRYVVTATEKGILRRWSCEKLVEETIQSGTEAIVWLGHGVDGKSFYVCFQDGQVEEWNRATLKRTRTFRVACQSVTAMAVDSDGRRLVTSDLGPAVQVWTVDKAATLNAMWGVRDWTSMVAMASEGKRAAFRDVAERSICGVELKEDGSVGQPTTLFKGTVDSLTFVGRSNRLALGCVDGKVRCIDSLSGKVEMELGEINRGARSLASSTDGRLLAAGYPGGDIVVWDTKTKKVLLKVEAHPAIVVGLRISPDRTRLLSWCSDIGFNDRPGYAEAKLFKIPARD